MSKDSNPFDNMEAELVDQLVRLLREKRKTGKVTPETVAALAALTTQTDDGIPIAPADHHWLWLHLICNTQIKRLLIIGTPESAKSTWILAYMLNLIAFHPQWPGFVACATGPVARKRSISLRNMVQSARFRYIFPDIVPADGMSWKEDEWSVAEHGVPNPGRLHPTISAFGTGGGSIIGTRARYAIFDDILHQENTRTEGGRKTTADWFFNSFVSRVSSRVGLVRGIGNAWHHDDLHARLRKNSQWVVCHIPLLSEGEEVYAEITYPDDYTGPVIGEMISEGASGLTVQGETGSSQIVTPKTHGLAF